ncbi:hypothetical protein HA51_24035 [Pantoea rwandensis]|uniref:Uncharacterized protein n=2 Tax=Pantoea rwandensis TaxID=1076550 RepID=A0A1X1CP09_9GAMM|nr:hypothetical protein HA51_24035 [Pantoea rwandensis]
MRITVLDDDPGIRINPGIERYRITIDGEEVNRCLSADDVAGEVIEVSTDADGNIEIEYGEVKTRTRNGVVTIERI